MGKTNSKIANKKDPKQQLTCKDWKFVENQCPSKTKHLNLWITKYEFAGQLNTQKIFNLQDKIKTTRKDNKKKMSKDGYEDTEFWMVMAQKRREDKSNDKIEKESKNKRWEKEKEMGENTVMFQRKEDDETGPVGFKKEEKWEDREQTPEKSLQSTLYPPLPSSPLPPSPPPTGAVGNTMQTRKKGNLRVTFSKTMGKLFSPEQVKLPSSEEELQDSFPMIEVANPNVDDDSPTILVHRTWTQEDVKKAVDGITSHKIDVNEFVQQMEDLRRSYHLNGVEVQQVWMAALKNDWHSVRGDWEPKDCHVVLAHDSRELAHQVRRLMDRTREKFKVRANYTAIGRVTQKEGEPFDDYRVRMTACFKANSGIPENHDEGSLFEEQLKNALHANTHHTIHQWVEKHWVDKATGTLEQYISQALHAERVLQAKKKKTDTFIIENEENEFYFQNRGKGFYQNRGRGRGRPQFKIGPAGKGRGYATGPKEVTCWCCGETGHFSRHCPHNRNDA
ncbi:uncharacterized protein LOC144059629 [Vanacampus margaritifer]